MATVNLNPAQDYTQPKFSLPETGGWMINGLDYQIVTKSDGWNQSQTKRLTEYRAGRDLCNVTHVAIGVPYDNTTKYTNYVADARTLGLKVWHRGHWNAWQGDNSVGSVTSITRNGTTATVTTSTNHLMVTGQTVVIADATQTDYNGEYTITVTGANTFTYEVANSPATPATGTILWRYGRQTYLDKTYDFIVDNPTFFEDGDYFTLCVECNNADGASKNWTFRDTGKSSGTFSFTKYNQFLKDQITYANAGFKAIGKSVKTNLLSLSLSLTDLNGQTLDGGDGGNANGLDNADVVQYLDGLLTIDHYLSDAYRIGADNYATKYGSDLDKLKVAFPDCQIMIGEWGYHTTTSVSESERSSMYAQVIDVIRSKSYIYGVCFWNHMGQTSSSIFTDSSGDIVMGGRNAAKEVYRAFSGGNATFGWRHRV